MLEFVKTWGAFILAVIANITPFVAPKILRRFSKSNVKVFLRETAELGFSNFGLTCGVKGSIKVDGKSVFISNIKAVIKRKRDKAEHHLEWLVFRSNILDVNNLKPVSFENPGGFLLNQEVPYKFDIVFYSPTISATINSVLNDYTNRLLDLEDESGLNQLRQVDEQEGIVRVKNEVVEKLRKDPINTTTWSALKKLEYWEEGEYSLEISAYSEKNVVAHQTNDFRLEHEEADAVNLNIINMMNVPVNEFLKLGRVNFRFTNVALNEV